MFALQRIEETETIREPVWQDLALCNDGRGSMTELFFSEQLDDIAAAKAFCGGCPVREECLDVVRSLVGELASYVQAQADADVDQAPVIIESSGFSIRAASTRRKLGFVVKQGRVSGTAIVEVLAVAKRASYEHRWSADGGKTWNPAGMTLQTKMTIRGLPVGVSVLFTCRPCTKSGEGDWMEPYPFLVK